MNVGDQDRSLDETHLGLAQRAALEAAVHDCRSVREWMATTPSTTLGGDDLDWAEQLLIHLQAGVREPRDERSALRVFAGADWMLQPSEGVRRTHDCPVCGLPALGSPRYPRAVCRRCCRLAADSHGRRIAGYNTSLGGGFVAHFVDDDGVTGDVCAEVTDSGQCWVEGRPCTIAEARFGGVVVEVVA